MYKLFLCLRYLLYRRIAIVPIMAVMLCVAMEMIVTSVMGGFVDAVRTAARGLFGDVIIGENTLTGFGYYDAYRDAAGREHPGLLQYLQTLSADQGRAATMPELAPLVHGSSRPIIAAATPLIESAAVLRLPNRPGFTVLVRVAGIVPDTYARVTEFQQGLYWEKPGPGGAVTVEPDLPSPMLQELLEDQARLREPMRWRGPPSFDQIPDVRDPAGPAVALQSAGGEEGDAVGLIMGIRVLWPSPDKQGRYMRQRFLPGQEPAQLALWPMTVLGTPKDPITRQFRLVDTSYSRIQQIDSAVSYVPFDRLQEYLGMGASDEPTNGFLAPARATRVLVKLADGVSLEEGEEAIRGAVKAWKQARVELNRQARDAVEESLREPRARARQRLDQARLAWDGAAKGGDPAELERTRQAVEQARKALSTVEAPLRALEAYEPEDVDVTVWEKDKSNEGYFSAIENQRVIGLLIVGVVSLTVIALIWVIFIMIVVEKTKDIGIVKSVGGSAWGVAQIFLIWSGIIGLIGAVLGGTLGYLFVVHMNEIEQWLSHLLHTQIWDPRAYLFEHIPARFKWSEMLWTAATAVVAAMLGALVPAVRAARMNPVEALRYE